MFSPCGSGYQYSTIGGPGGGSFGSVQVSPGSQISMAVGPQGGVIPIVTPSQPIPAASHRIVVPEYIPEYRTEYIPEPFPVYVRMPTPRPKTHVPAPSPSPKRISKAERDATLAEMNQLYKGIAVDDRKQFWDDFYADWRVAPQTPIPTEYMIPYLRMWSRTHGIDISKYDAKSDAK